MVDEIDKERSSDSSDLRTRDSVRGAEGHDTRAFITESCGIRYVRARNARPVKSSRSHLPSASNQWKDGKWLRIVPSSHLHSRLNPWATLRSRSPCSHP